MTQKQGSSSTEVKNFKLVTRHEAQVIEDDPLNSLESSTDGDNFCDICGLYLETSKELENHYESSHELVTYKWCKTKNRLTRDL